MQNLGGQTKSIMVFFEMAYSITRFRRRCSFPQFWLAHKFEKLAHAYTKYP